MRQKNRIELRSGIGGKREAQSAAFQEIEASAAKASLEHPVRANELIESRLKLDKWDVELGAAYGFTMGSDRFVLKAILTTLSLPDKDGQADQQASSLKMSTTSRYPQNGAPYGIGWLLG